MLKKDFYKKLINNDFFAGLTEEDLNSINPSLFKLNHYDEKTEIITQNTKAEDIFFVVKGSVDILKETSKQKDQKYLSRYENDFVGESALIPNELRNSTVIANDDSEIISLNKKDALELLETFPIIKDNLIRTIAHRYQESDSKAIQEKEKYNMLFSLNRKIVAQQNELQIVNSKLRETLNELQQKNMEIIENQEKILKLERKNSVYAMMITANHEINQPLMVISGNVELLSDMLSKEKLNPRVDKILERILKATKRISKILNTFKKMGEVKFKYYSDSTKMVDIDIDEY